MSVLEEGVVDAIGVDRTSGEVVLTIADHLEWEQPSQHLRVLQAKLNRYLAFVESGELARVYPDGLERAVRVDVVFKFDPPTPGLAFLANAEHTLRSAGFSFKWYVHRVHT